MNPNACTIVLRARNPFEVFDLTLLYVHANAAPLLRLMAATVLPAFLFCGALAWGSGGHWASLVPTLAVCTLLQGPFTVHAGHLLFDTDLGVWASLRQAYRPSMLASEIGAYGFLVLAIPFTFGMWVVAGAFYSETLLLERVGARRAMSRANRIAAGHVGIALVAGVSRFWLTLWSALVAEGAGQLILQQGLQLGQPFGSLTTLEITPFLIFGILAAQPLHALYRLMLYVDARTRVEGWDLQVALNSAAQERL